MTPTESSTEKLLIRWQTKDEAAIEAIRKRFNIPHYTTVNGISPAEISSEDKDLFEETARRGFFGIIHRKWCKNGEVFIFQSR